MHWWFNISHGGLQLNPLMHLYSAYLSTWITTTINTSVLLDYNTSVVFYELFSMYHIPEVSEKFEEVVFQQDSPNFIKF